MTLDAAQVGAPLLAKVCIYGPLEAVAGYQGECGGWCDGYGGEGGIIARMRAALADADVLLMCDSPGGSAMGLPECVDAIIEAKAEYGRRIYVVACGWAASAMYWIASCVADAGEFYLTRSSMIGNIGARAAHCNQAGALAQAGLDMTDFAFPPGKIALSPNRAPTEAGIARGNRDVMAAFELFASSVGAARPALTREAIVALDGDLLTGRAAVKKALADAVASVEDVETWALARATPGDEQMSEPGEGAAPPSKPGATAEQDEPKMACAKCGDERGSGEARYCMKCGTKYPEQDPEDAPDSDDMAARSTGGDAARVGAMSLPALRAHALDLGAQLSDVMATLGGARSKTAIGGKVERVVADAGKAARYRRERNEYRASAEYRERLDLLSSLYTADPAGHPRGKLVVDIIDDKGKMTGQIRPAELWSDGERGRTLANLRSYAASTLASLNGSGKGMNRTPYDAPLEASEERAGDQRAAVRTATTGKDPGVVKAVRAGVSQDVATAIHDREFGGAK